MTAETIAAPAPAISCRNVSVFYGDREAIGGVTIDFAPKTITALMGPSGCGKTTLLRALNRIHEAGRGTRVTGDILLFGENVHEGSAITVRRRVGMVFQRPNPFPTMSVQDNVIAGLDPQHRRKNGAEAAERALRDAGLWDQVKDRLNRPAIMLSGGQQQRLCIARALAVEPDVLLMDEPTASLDPIATSVIEDLVHELGQKYTVVIVTHNMQQAARVSQRAAFMLGDENAIGRLIEVGDTGELFMKPKDKRTEDYITGRFG